MTEIKPKNWSNYEFGFIDPSNFKNENNDGLQNRSQAYNRMVDLANRFNMEKGLGQDIVQGHLKEAIAHLTEVNKSPLFVVNIITNDFVQATKVCAMVFSFADMVVLNVNEEAPKTIGCVAPLGRELKIIHTDWENDFAKARNQCLEHTPDNSWVLWLDTDDVLSPETIEHLKWVKENLLKTFHPTVYELKLINEGIGDTHFQRRIFPYKKPEYLTEAGYDLDSPSSNTVPSIAWEGKVHERLSIGSGLDLEVLGLEIARLEGPVILHTGYKDPEMRKQKAERNLAIMLSIPFEARTNTDNLQLGDSYASKDEYAAALFYYLEITEEDPAVLYKIGICYQKLGGNEKAKRYYLSSRTIEGVGATILVEYQDALGRLLFKTSKLIQEYRDNPNMLPSLEMYRGYIEQEISRLEGIK